MSTRPYISVVIAARNDNHGGNMLGRMQACLDTWIVQARELGLASEVVIVDWNHPEGRARLIDELRWPLDLGPVAVRFIEVTPEVHRRLPNAAAIPLHQMIAKNVGIRRARGEFVLVTNLDILFSPELMRFLAGRTLERGVMYRMDRYDIASDIPPEESVDGLLAFARHNIKRLFTREGLFHLAYDGRRQRELQDLSGPDSQILFGPGWYAVDTDGYERFRWMEDEAQLYVDDRPAGASELLLEVETGPSAAGKPVNLTILDAARQTVASASLLGRCQLELTLPNHAFPAVLTLRLEGAGAPLVPEMRLLHLRLFSARWRGREDARPGQEPPRAGPLSVAHLDVRSLDLAIDPGAGALLEAVDLKLVDAAGQVVYQGAVSQDLLESAGRTPSPRYSLRVRIATGRNHPDQIDRPWSLQVCQQRPGSDWSPDYQSPVPHSERVRRAAYLHTNACGDFTLLHRDDWSDLRAYPEFPIWPIHVDSLFCYAAFHAGIREQVLEDPMRIYHVEHLSGAGWTPEGEDALNARIARKAVPTIPYAHFIEWVERMRRFDAPMIFTPPNWGMADLDLPEYSV
jgi:hypothetical protein